MKIRASLLGLLAATAIAVPATAQEFYAGGSISKGSYDAFRISTGAFSSSGNSQGLTAFAGARFPVGSQFFVGGEIRYGKETGHYQTDGSAFTKDDVPLLGARAQVGYAFSDFRVYGFAGIGSAKFVEDDGVDIYESKVNTKSFGLGVETHISKKVSLRVEAEIMNLSNIDTCCVYQGSDMKIKSVSVGALYNF